MSAESDQIAAAAAEITAATTVIGTVRSTPLDPAATERSVAEETFARIVADAWLRRFVGQTANDTPLYSAHTGVAGTQVADGDTLELAVAKLAGLFTLINRHQMASGLILPLATSKTALQVNQMDLLDTAQAANNVASNNGPFWLLCDGTTQASVATPDFRGRIPIGWSDSLTASARAALGLPSIAVAANAGKAATYQRLADLVRHQHTIDHTHGNASFSGSLNTQGDDVGSGTQAYGIGGTTSLAIPAFSGNSGVVPTNGTYNDTTKQLTIDDTTGLVAGDIITVNHGSLSGGTQELQIASVVDATKITFVTNAFDGLGNLTGVTYRSWTPALNPVRGVLWIMRSARTSYY